MPDVWGHLGSTLGCRMTRLAVDVELGVHLLVAPPKNSSRDLELLHLLLYPRHPMNVFLLLSPPKMEFDDILFYVSDNQ